MSTNSATDLRQRMEEVHREHGEWTAMAIHLGDGLYTTPTPAPDHRLRRLLQVAQDACRKPLDQCRALDLACLEGHYALEFAMHGAEAVGIEGRRSNVAKCWFAKEALGLDRLSFVQDDMRNLDRGKYGGFDVVICSGILYHLDAPDVFRFVEAIGEVCDGVAIIDTYVSVSDELDFEYKGKTYHGRDYVEKPADQTDEDHQADAWASIANTKSVWLTRASLYNLLGDVGFTSVMEVHLPHHPDPGITADRITLVAIKGTPVEVRSSPITDRHELPRCGEEPNTGLHPTQLPQSALKKSLKRTVPRPLLEAVKAVKRKIKGKSGGGTGSNPWEWEVPWKKRGGS